MPCESATVRVRTRDDRSWLTIKSHSDCKGLSRYEFEKEITNDEAQHLFELCRGGVIDKCRWPVKSPDGKHTFEVEEFFGDNEGLVVAEVEGAVSALHPIENLVFFILYLKLCYFFTARRTGFFRVIFFAGVSFSAFITSSFFSAFFSTFTTSTVNIRVE